MRYSMWLFFHCTFLPKYKRSVGKKESGSDMLSEIFMEICRVCDGNLSDTCLHDDNLSLLCMHCSSTLTVQCISCVISRVYWRKTSLTFSVHVLSDFPRSVVIMSRVTRAVLQCTHQRLRAINLQRPIFLNPKICERLNGSRYIIFMLYWICDGTSLIWSLILLLCFQLRSSPC